MKRATFNTELRWAIRRTGKSEAAFARHIEMSPTYLSRILNQDDYRPSPEMIRRFAEGLDLPVETVAGWSDISDAMGLAAMPEMPAPASTVRDSDRLTVARMVALVESWPGEEFQRRRAATEQRLSAEAYQTWCVDLFRMWEGNSFMVFDLTERLT